MATVCGGSHCCMCQPNQEHHTNLLCHLLWFNFSLSCCWLQCSVWTWLSAFHEVIWRMHFQHLKPALLAECRFSSQSSHPTGHCYSSSDSFPHLPVCSAQLNSPSSTRLGKGQAFPSRLKLLYLMYLVGFRRMPIFITLPMS